jgi:hypothetical protein
MKKPLALVLALPLLALPATAKIDGCYSVRYDAAVLKRHPKLQVDAVSLQNSLVPTDEENHDIVSFRLHKNQHILTGAIDCSGPNSKLNCKINDSLETDVGGTKYGGSFVLTETATGATIDVRNDLYLFESELYSGSGSSVLHVSNNPEHQHFTLLKDPKCSGLM